MIRSSLSTLAVATLALCGAGRSSAATLLDLLNPPDETGTSYALSFTAGAPTTDISFAGYQNPARLWAEDISLTSGGGNLLGTTWTFTPFDTLDTIDSGQFDDGFGSGTNGLFFANGTGRLDEFDQLVTTVVGDSYSLDFLFINNPRGPSGDSGPSELIVSGSGATPEPASIILSGLGLLAVGLLTRRKLVHWIIVRLIPIL